MAIQLPDLLGRVRIDTSELDRLGGRIESSLSGVSSTMGKLGASAGRALQSALEPIAIATGAFVGTALVKGFGRFTTIENSVAALTVTLGDAGKAGKFLQGVLDIVTGTPFNLDQFVNAGKNLVAVGIDADQVLGKGGLLTTIGEIAASSGGGAAEVDQLVGAFAKVKSEGKLTGDTLRQLAQNGVPALAILANHFNKTTDEMRKMVSEGAVPADEAIAILSKGIIEGSDGIAGATVKLGGSMDKLRQTTTGAFGGMMAGIDRLGEAFFKGLTGIDQYGEGTNRLAQLMTSLTGIIDNRLKPAFENAGEAVGRSLERVLPAVDKLSDVMSQVSEKSGGLGKLLGPLTAAFAALGLQGVATALGPLGALIPTIGPIAAAFVAMTLQSDSLKDTFGKLWETLQPLISRLADALLPTINALIPVVERIVAVLGETLIDVIERLAPDIITVVEALAPLAVMFAELAATLIEKLEPILGPVATGFAGLLIANKVAVALTSLFWIINAHPIGLLITALAALAAGLIYAYEHSETFRNVVDTTFVGLQVAVATAVEVVISLLHGLVDTWLDIAGAFVKGAALAFSWVPGVGPQLEEVNAAFEKWRASVNSKFEDAKRAAGDWKNKTIADAQAAAAGAEAPWPGMTTRTQALFNSMSIQMRSASEAMRAKVVGDAGAVEHKLFIVGGIDARPTITVDNGPALAAIGAVQGALGGLRDKTVTITGQTKGSWHPPYHGGGPVFHKGGPVQSMHFGGLKSDERLAKLQVGEFVWSRAAVRAMGMGNLAAMHAGAARGNTGAGVGGGTNVNIGTVILKTIYDPMDPMSKRRAGQEFRDIIRGLDGEGR